MITKHQISNIYHIEKKREQNQRRTCSRMELLEEVCGQRSSEHQALEDHISKAAANKREFSYISECVLQSLAF